MYQKRVSNRWGVQLALRLLIFLTLTGTVAQVLLQGFTLPDEMPRAAIERLTGIDINPQHQADCTIMPMMHMHHHHGHHHGPSHESCILCPLLVMTALILTSLPALPGCSAERYRQEHQSYQARAPPPAPRTLPPSRAPPLSF